MLKKLSAGLTLTILVSLLVACSSHQQSLAPPVANLACGGVPLNTGRTPQLTKTPKDAALKSLTAAFQAAQNANVEDVIFVQQNPTTGAIITTNPQNLTLDPITHTVTMPAPPPPPSGFLTVGIAHTHPDNYGTTPNFNGIDSAASNAIAYNPYSGYSGPEFTNTYFSVPDEQYANYYGISMYVLVEAVNGMSPSFPASYDWAVWNGSGAPAIGTNPPGNSYSSGTEGGSLNWNAC